MVKTLECIVTWIAVCLRFKKNCNHKHLGNGTKKKCSTHKFNKKHACLLKQISYHLVSQSIAALWSCRWPAPCPALASVAMMTINSGKPVPSPFASMSVAIGMSVLRRTVHTPSPTWLLSRTMWVVSSCRSCRFSCTTSNCSESFGGAAVMRVSQDCRREGSTQASWAKEPHRHNRLGFGLFSAAYTESIVVRLRPSWAGISLWRGEDLFFFSNLYGFLAW